MSAQRAAAVVNETITNLILTERYIGQAEPWARDLFAMAVDAGLGDGTSTREPKSPRPSSLLKIKQIVFNAQDVATRRIWQRSRVVYDIDPELWNELGAVDEDTVLPARVFAHLPHPDPFIVWPELEPFSLEDGASYMRSAGCFVTGRSASTIDGRLDSLGWSVSTHSPYAVGDLVITIVSDVLEPDGRPHRVESMDNAPDTIISRVSLDVGGVGDVRVGDLIDRIAARYRSEMTLESGATFERTVRPTLRRIISTLLYLCATNVDLRPLPMTSARRVGTGNGRTVKPPRTFAVGYAVGSGLRAWRRAQSLGATSEPTGRSMRPHIRRAHPHLYWTGEGRKIPRVRWVWPIRVNADAGIKLTTVEPVKKVKVRK